MHTRNFSLHHRYDTMIILGVDPGTLITGYGVVEKVGSRTRLLEYGAIWNGSENRLPARLKLIYSRLRRIIRKYRPDEFAIETAFYGKNAQSAMKLGHARGVSLLAAVNANIPAAEYSPREVKKSVVGNGAASKDQVQFMVKNLLRMKESPKFYDSTDALAVALCHLHRIAGVKSSSKSWKLYLSAHPDRVVQPLGGRKQTPKDSAHGLLHKPSHRPTSLRPRRGL